MVYLVIDKLSFNTPSWSISSEFYVYLLFAILILLLNKDKKKIIPKFGLNFLKNENKKNNNFLLICGFENFNKFYIRVDILERLFLKIIENSKDGTFKIDSDMINLIGCSKDNF